MSFTQRLSCRDGSSVRVDPEFVVAVEPEGPDGPPVSRCRGACRVSLAGGEQLDVPGEVDEVQRTLGLVCIRLALFRNGRPIFLNPSLVLAVEDQSGGQPLVTKSLVTVIVGRFNDSTGRVLAPAFLVRETGQEILDAIQAAEAVQFKPSPGGADAGGLGHASR
jgi:hypothetical protein